MPAYYRDFFDRQAQTVDDLTFNGPLNFFLDIQIDTLPYLNSHDLGPIVRYWLRFYLKSEGKAILYPFHATIYHSRKGSQFGIGSSHIII